MKLIKNLSLFFLLFLSISCSKGLPFNIFDPETFVGFLIGIDPFRYNPPPKSIIKYQGAVSSISEGGSIQLGVLLENNPYGNVKLNISSNVSLLTFNGQETTSLTFDSSNYSTEQLVTIAAGIDANSTNEQATISFSADGLVTQTLSLTITDDLAVRLSGTVTTIQEGETLSLGVNLSNK
ncbi:MAG: hypothetical protein KDK36_03380 [Leptospiraceae bacterium]|nr:hypothetical protein [Leptospiraceae bacterium]